MKKLIRKLADHFGVTEATREETCIAIGDRLSRAAEAFSAAGVHDAHSAMTFYARVLRREGVPPMDSTVEAMVLAVKDSSKPVGNVPGGRVVLPGRKVGNTTRIIDACVQELFTTGTTRYADHHKEGKSWKANDGLLHRLLKRLWLEHGLPSRELNAHNGTLNCPKILFEKSIKA